MGLYGSLSVAIKVFAGDQARRQVIAVPVGAFAQHLDAGGGDAGFLGQFA